MEYAWLCSILVVFLLQVLPYPSRRWVTDESWYAGPGYSIAQGHGVRDPAIGPNDLENSFDARPPGTALVVAGAFKLFGVGPVTARLGSIFAGLMIVCAVYGLTRDVLGWQGSIFAALLVATDNLIVLAARTARPEALTVMVLLLSLLALKQYWVSGRVLWAFTSGLLMAMATMFHITVLGYIVSFGLLLIALDRNEGRSPLRAALPYTAGYFMGLIPFAVWILTAPLGRLGFRQEFMSRAVDTALWTKFLSEGHRYSDVLGLNLIHAHGFESLPVRLPIPLCFLAATVILWKFQRSRFYIELLLLLPSVFWLIYTINKSSRYIAILAPLFAMTIGAAVAATRDRRLLHRAVLTAATLVIVAQAGANLVLLRAAGKADYNKVGSELRELIPATETTYASITFWLAFHDRSFISYERTSPWMAAQQYHARYFILGDRVMRDGLRGNEEFLKQLNVELGEVTAHSTLVGRVNDPYYGELMVYRLDH